MNCRAFVLIQWRALNAHIVDIYIDISPNCHCEYLLTLSNARALIHYLS